VIDYGARFYDPTIGRFMSVDPLADLAPDWNPYRYGFNNPIKYLDPDGLFESKVDAQDFIDNEGISGDIVENDDGTFYIQGSGDQDGQQFSFGASSSLNGSESLESDSQLAESKDPLSSRIWAGTLMTAAVTSQVDSPVPGPADLVALGELALGGTAAIITYFAIDRFADSGIVSYKKISTNSAANEAARGWGYEDAHDLKDAHDVGSEYDIYRDGKTGKGELRPRKGKPGEHKEIHPNN